MSENAGSAKAMENKKQTNGKGSKGSAAKKKINAVEASLNMDEIRELADLVDEHGFTDFEFENSNIRVRLSKTPQPQIVQSIQPFANVPANPPSPQTVAQQTETAPVTNNETETSAGEDLHKITSPIVGTFYRSPAPDKEPYIKEGSSVSSDTVVCIVEAMKLMNEIQAEISGKVVKIYVESGQPVEFGQPLFGIKV